MILGHKKWKSALKECELGTSAVEFALLTPVIVMLVLGLIDFGRAFIYKMELLSAARAGGQYAILEDFDSDTIQSIVSGSTNLTDITFNSVAQSCSCEDGTSVDCDADCDDASTKRKFVTISVTAPFNAYFYSNFVSEVSATVEMRTQ